MCYMMVICKDSLIILTLDHTIKDKNNVTVVASVVAVSYPTITLSYLLVVIKGVWEIDMCDFTFANHGTEYAAHTKGVTV